MEWVDRLDEDQVRSAVVARTIQDLPEYEHAQVDWNLDAKPLKTSAELQKERDG